VQAPRRKSAPDTAAAEPVRDKAETLAEAEEFALAHPSQAALIRSLGRLPKKFAGAQMTPDLVRAIVNGDSAILQALVKKPTRHLAPVA
jgi:hypothetical protein